MRPRTAAELAHLFRALKASATMHSCREGQAITASRTLAAALGSSCVAQPVPPLVVAIMARRSLVVRAVA